MESELDYYINRTCLFGVVGSVAQGRATEESDTDYAGVFIEPASDIAGLDWNKGKEFWNNQSPFGDDYTFYEIGKLVSLALQSNPFAVEILFLGKYDIQDDVGDALLDLRYSLISEQRVREAYIGVVTAKIREIERMTITKPKSAIHALRLARQGYTLLTTGEVVIEVENSAEYLNLTRRGKDSMLSIINKELEPLKTCSSVLREKPDRKSAVEFIKKVRKEYI